MRPTSRPILAIAALLLAAGSLFDHVPRFFQGDSISYLSTDGSHIPPDRSWMFGFAVNGLLRATHGHFAYIALQLAVAFAVLLAWVGFFRSATGWRRVAYAALALGLCLDPLTQLYARFYMSDLLAALLFVGLLAMTARAVEAPGAAFRRWLPALALLVTFLVFIRLAYAAIIVVTLGLVTVATLRRGRPALPVLGRLAVLAALPPLAVAGLVAANGVLFAKRFPGEVFANKMSGIMLLGSFAPALDGSDFAAGGVPLTQSQVDRLDLQHYDVRGHQIWGADEASAKFVIKRTLGIDDDYSPRLEQAASRIVGHALRRNPVGLLEVYAETLALHFRPSEWRKFLDLETGTLTPLPDHFVLAVNALASPPIWPAIVALPSPALRAFEAAASAYPVVLALGLVGALIHLVVRRPAWPGVFASAGFLAVLLTVPLYTVYVIPRYLIASVLLTAVLWALLLAGRPESV